MFLLIGAGGYFLSFLELISSEPTRTRGDDKLSLHCKSFHRKGQCIHRGCPIALVRISDVVI
jgi:hypothetical protein